MPGSKMVQEQPHQAQKLLWWWYDHMPWWTKTPVAHGTLREELGPLKEKGTHCWRIFLGVSRLVASHNQDLKKNHKAGTIHMQESIGNILQQGSLHWCWYITSMLSQTHDITTISNMWCYTSRSPTSQIDPPADKKRFNYPKIPPYLPTSENMQKL